MACLQCELKRAKLLIKARRAVGNFDLDEVLKELEYRWPNRFYLECDPGADCRIMQRNTVAPYTPTEVYDSGQPSK